jgi:hypothetical protein
MGLNIREGYRKTNYTAVLFWRLLGTVMLVPVLFRVSYLNKVSLLYDSVTAVVFEELIVNGLAAAKAFF